MDFQAEISTKQGLFTSMEPLVYEELRKCGNNMIKADLCQSKSYSDRSVACGCR